MALSLRSKQKWVANRSPVESKKETGWNRFVDLETMILCQLNIEWIRVSSFFPCVAFVVFIV
jgi:hypothetical protein